MTHRGALIAAMALLAVACGSSVDSSPTASPPSPTTAVEATEVASDDQRHPDVLDAELTARDDGTWTMAATISSPYDTPERYADAFRVLTPDGDELVVRVLTHDHADEQPFTRTSDAFAIPDGVEELVVEGRDQVHSWGGDTVTVPVPSTSGR